MLSVIACGILFVTQHQDFTVKFQASLREGGITRERNEFVPKAPSGRELPTESGEGERA